MRATRVRKILFSQNPPADFEKSPYAGFAKLYNVKIDFHKFFQVDEVSLNDFRKQNISMSDYTAIIMTSKNAVDHFFRIVNGLKIKISEQVRYFCANAAVASYLQKYTVLRKKAKFPEDGSYKKLVDEIAAYSSDVFLLPSAMDSSINQLIKLLDEQKINYTKAEVFKISFPDMKKKIDIYSYDIIIFFSPYGIQNLLQSYPDFKQENITIGAFGTSVIAAAQEAGLQVQIIAPTVEHSSIFSALDKHLQKTNTRQR